MLNELDQIWYRKICDNICHGISSNTLPIDERIKFWDMLNLKILENKNGWSNKTRDSRNKEHPNWGGRRVKGQKKENE
jgi:hypothetical protein